MSDTEAHRMPAPSKPKAPRLRAYPQLGAWASSKGFILGNTSLEDQSHILRKKRAATCCTSWERSRTWALETLWPLAGQANHRKPAIRVLATVASTRNRCSIFCHCLAPARATIEAYRIRGSLL